ncbi:hypothetical protein PoB_000644600 [Plakobranchus ocellatus]|uniref:Uncharacterized protein n=1 Tax=Plakobranchus ocellatus TaxID=259542 RepID=A0AAV3XYB8_9GAST|nr:hypothetical protein PoB_000644600 [Plakobranchus ocellatus]
MTFLPICPSQYGRTGLAVHGSCQTVIGWVDDDHHSGDNGGDCADDDGNLSALLMHLADPPTGPSQYRRTGPMVPASCQTEIDLTDDDRHSGDDSGDCADDDENLMAWQMHLADPPTGSE